MKRSVLLLMLIQLTLSAQSTNRDKPDCLDESILSIPAREVARPVIPLKEYQENFTSLIDSLFNHPKIEKSIIVKVCVDTNGVPLGAKILRGFSPSIDSLAILYVLQTKFLPGITNNNRKMIMSVGIPLTKHRSNK